MGPRVCIATRIHCRSLLCQVYGLVAIPGNPCAREFVVQTTTLHHLPSGVYIADQRRDATNHLATTTKSSHRIAQNQCGFASPTCARPASQDSLPDGKKRAAATPPHRRGGKQAGGTKTYIHSYRDKMMAAQASLGDPQGPESTYKDATAK